MKNKRPVWFKCSLDVCRLMIIFDDATVGRAVKAAARLFLDGDREYLQGDGERAIYELFASAIDESYKSHARSVADGIKGADVKKKKQATLSHPKAPLSEVEVDVEADVEADVDGEGDKRPPRPPTLNEVQQYAKTEQLTFVNTEKFFWHYDGKNWKGVTDWKSTIRKWNAEDQEKKKQNKKSMPTPDTQRTTDWDALVAQQFRDGLRG